MRRIAAIVALSLGLLTVACPSAAAHACATPAEVPVGKSAKVTVGVTAELDTITEVDIAIPAGFRLEAAEPAAGWTLSQEPAVVRYQGGSISPFDCGFFVLEGTPLQKAKIALPLTVRTADGAATEYAETEPFDARSAQLIYAGVPLEDDFAPPTTGGSSRDPIKTAGLVLLGVGVIGGTWLVLQRRRAEQVIPPRRGATRSTPRGRAQRGSARSRSGNRKRPPPRRK